MSGADRLTPTQLLALRRAQELGSATYGVRMVNNGPMRRMLRDLFSRGLLSHDPNLWSITDAGREALAANSKGASA